MPVRAAKRLTSTGQYTNAECISYKNEGEVTSLGVSAKDLAATFDGKLAALRAEADARRQAEVQALEDAATAHVQVNADFRSQILVQSVH